MNALRHRVLTALALNRTPGFTFAGNFLGVRFAESSPRGARVEMDHGAHSDDGAGQTDPSAICLLADVAMATAVRALLSPEQRLATVSMSLQFTGAPLAGALESRGECQQFVDGSDSRQGLCSVSLHANGQLALFGTGAFMVMNPPLGTTMHPIVSAVHAGATPLAEHALDTREALILARAEQALCAAGDNEGFLRHFWGFLPEATADGAHCVTPNGPHLGNRVGHLQGGLQLGMALATAGAALPRDWAVSGISACFLSAGEGSHIRADARLEHRGRNTAVVRTVLSGKDGRRVLVADTTHLRRG